ncbi:hypothetical protein E2C01_032060 [Portunus trituberculatus]|uniref:Uncharacterized protein n=1 Tax=Portunus trituberculatus TaxID=210409 RepID=A0A5B7EV26_PORTR|nr:hypothetical protein [Portunus trituberculatus]
MEILVISGTSKGNIRVLLLHLRCKFSRSLSRRKSNKNGKIETAVSAEGSVVKDNRCSVPEKVV